MASLVVKKNIPQSKNSFSIILQKPTHFHFYPGQYLDINLPDSIHDPLGQARAFSISSSPTEDFLMITPKKGISVFKKYLATLHPGDSLSTSHPAGTFILDENTPAVLIAAGVGITPFRSIIKYALDKKLTTPITLIYINSDKDFIFKKELEQWQKSLSNLKIIYHNSTKNGRLIKLYPIPYTLYPIYYLAGPPKMVDQFAQTLIESGVDEIAIRYDRFDGY